MITCWYTFRSYWYIEYHDIAIKMYTYTYNWCCSCTILQFRNHLLLIISEKSSKNQLIHTWMYRTIYRYISTTYIVFIMQRIVWSLEILPPTVYKNSYLFRSAYIQQSTSPVIGMEWSYSYMIHGSPQSHIYKLVYLFGSTYITYC